MMMRKRYYRASQAVGCGGGVVAVTGLVFGSITFPKNKWHRLPDGHDYIVSSRG